jgi:ribonuclease HI
MIEAYFDGACTPINPGGIVSWGYIIRNGDEVIEGKGSDVRDLPSPLEEYEKTNNVAEYLGLSSLLDQISKRGIKNVSIHGDSQLVVNVVSGLWGKKKVHKNAPHLRRYALYCREKLKETGSSIKWIPREQNMGADKLSKDGYLDSRV